MSHDEDKTITARQAAKLIFRTEHPSESQTTHVENAIFSGELKGSQGNGLRTAVRTTPAYVAAFLAEKTVESRKKRIRRKSYNVEPKSQSSGAAPTIQSRSAYCSDELSNILKESFREYFLTVLMLRKNRRTSKLYRNFVLVGQAVLLLFITCVIVLVVWPIATGRTPHEHVLIEEWLEDHTQEFRITTFHPPRENPTGEGCVVRVEYHYRRASGRGVDTVQYFTIADGSVVDVDSEFP